MGKVASGAPSPTLGYPIATAFVEAAQVKAGDTVEVEIRGKRFPAEVVKPVFYRRSK
ncbi:Aminomethyltransferase [compost metagenome]